jgi:DNA modification methylase
LNYADRRVGEVSFDDEMDWSSAWACFPGEVAYVWHAGRYGVPAIESLEKCNFLVRTQIIWKKAGFVISRGHYNWQHEPCWYAVRKGKKAHWIGDHSQSTIWEIAPVAQDKENMRHGTQKPLECMARPIRNHEGDVYDPFIGTGTTMLAAEQLGRTTMLAAEQLGRTCYSMEIEPKYCAVTLERMNRAGVTGSLNNAP